MNQPNSIETGLLARCGELLQFAAENKTGLPGEIITDIESAWDAQSQSNWSPQIATKFWAAYDKLCSHLRPVTLDTLRASQPADTWLSRLGLKAKKSPSRRWARRFQILLLVVFATSMILAYIATTGDILLTEMNDSMKHGDETVESIRGLLAERPSEINDNTDFDKSALEPTSRIWVNKLRKQLVNLWGTADKLYDNTNARVSRLLFLGEYRLCRSTEYPTAEIICYFRGTIQEPRTLGDIT